jgi:aminotransferase
MTATATTDRFLSDRLGALLADRGEVRAGAATPLLNLGQGTPDLPTPAHVLEAVRRSFADPHIQYTPYDGVPALREAIAAKLWRDHALAYDPGAEIMVTNGSQEAIYVALSLLLDPGDELLIGDPHYTVYDEIAALLGARVVPVPSVAAQGFQYDVEAMARAVTARTKAILLVSPDNPTGAVQTPATLDRLAALAARHDLLVVSDELYERFVFDGAVHVGFGALPGMRERTLTIGGFSKAYAMTGWRVGYLAYPAAFRPAALLVKHAISICTSAPAQAAALAVLTGPAAPLEEMMAEWASRREDLYARLETMGIGVVRTPGAYYALLDVRAAGLSSTAFATDLAAAEGVRVTPGSVFGPAGEGYVRVSFMTPRPQLDEALDRLERFWVRVRSATTNGEEQP